MCAFNFPFQKKNKPKYKTPRGSCVSTVISRWRAWWSHMIWGLSGTHPGRHLFAAQRWDWAFCLFSPPLHTVAVNSQKFGDFYGLNRTAFSEYIGSWILYLACNWDLQVLNPLRELHYYYYFSRFLFHCLLLGPSAALSLSWSPGGVFAVCLHWRIGNNSAPQAHGGVIASLF